MRVVAGRAGGIPLQTPPGSLRPSMDKVKAAIFSSLGDRVPGARVLDLFAGSGALGIEALSRGALGAVFVESDRRAVACIRANLERTRLEGGVVAGVDVFRFLRGEPTDPPFDLILADPPYGRGPESGMIAGRLLASPGLSPRLAADGVLVLELGAGTVRPEPPGWETVRRRRYGAAEVWMLRPAPGATLPGAGVP